MRKVLYSILIIILGLFLWAQCVSVRVVTGENDYEGSEKKSTGVESNISTEKDTIP